MEEVEANAADEDDVVEVDDDQPTTSAATVDDSFDEGKACSICYDDYTNSGTHRLICLPCGHLFGKSCIDRWMSGGKGRAQQRCPKCKKRANRRDVRTIYARSVTMVDTTERDWALEQLRKERQENSELRVELTRAAQKLDDTKRLVTQLEDVARRVTERPPEPSSGAAALGFDAAIFSTGLTQVPPRPPPRVPLRLTPSAVVEVCKEGACRSLAVSDARFLLATCASPAPHLYKGYGFRRIDLHRARATDYVPVHSAKLRDVKLSPGGDGLVLSTAEDKQLRITSALTNGAVASFDLPSNGWSCAWRSDAPYYVFAGVQSGKVFMFDRRMLVASVGGRDTPPGGASVCQLDVGARPGGVADLAWIDSATHDARSSPGLLVSKLNETVFSELADGSDYRPNVLPISGLLSAATYDSTYNRFLASFRPSKYHSFVTHESPTEDAVELYELARPSGGTNALGSSYTATKVCSVTAGARQQSMTRNAIFGHPFCANRQLMVTFDEAGAALQARDTAHPEHAVAVARAPVGALHVQYGAVNDNHFLAAADQNRVHLYSLAKGAD